MQHSLTRIGDSLVFVIPKDIQERWNVLPETPLEVMADGDSLILKPVRNTDREAAIETAMQEADRRYSDTFRRLAQ